MKKYHNPIIRNMLAVTLLVVTAAASAGLKHGLQEWKPQIISPGSPSVQAGQSATLTVSGSPAAPADTTVTITTDSSISAPATVTVPSGQSSVSFTITVASSASGTHSVTAAANGSSVSANVYTDEHR